MKTANCGDSAPVVAMMVCVLGDMAVNVSTKVGVETSWLTRDRNGDIVLASDLSAGAVTDHLGAMAAVVEVGAELEHARVTVRLAAAAAAAEWI